MFVGLQYYHDVRVKWFSTSPWVGTWVSSCLGRLWELKEAVSSWRKWVVGRVCLIGYSYRVLSVPVRTISAS